MLRPERMSRVSVTGSRRVMDDVVETTHDLRLLHVSDYDGSWEGFDQGNPIEGADEAAEKLVTVRALESTLGVDDDDAGPRRLIDEESLDEEIEAIRLEVNELDDRREELRDELRSIEEQVEGLAPFVDVGVDLDLLSGYDSLEVVVGEGDAGAIEDALAASEAVDAFELFTGDDAVAAFVYAPDADDAVSDVLVGVPFQAYEIPDGEGDPAERRAALRDRRADVESDLEAVERELEDLRDDVGGYLLAAEEQLTIEVQKREAPLSFATTDNAFVAEGWLPTERYDELVAALEDAVGDRVEVEELERAAYDREVHHEHDENLGDMAEHDEAAAGATAASGVATADAAEGGAVAESEEGEEAAAEKEPVADGGAVTMGEDEPPVVQKNPSGVKPFQLLTEAVGTPKYTELDPTFVLFLTFPLMFGFMIGDVGYGLIYTGIGYWMYRNYEGDVWRNFAFVAMAAGVSTFAFGILYGEIFGLHLVSTYFWDPLIGGPLVHKGLQPHYTYWAQAWFVITAVFGVVHMGLGYVFEFVENNSMHGFKEAVLETGSWLFALVGLWLFVFSTIGYDAANPEDSAKPAFLFEVFNHGEHAAVPLGFSGFPPIVGWIGVALLAIGLLLLVVGPSHELVEIHVVLAHALSYLRISAVLLAKAGMAFAVNLLFFGAYETTDGEYHFMLDHGPQYVMQQHPEATIMFGGMMHGGIALTVAGVAVLLIGHLVVLVLGVTSSGIQAIRLEYFEFFSKFYDGGGTEYQPFGYDRSFTAEE